MFEAMGAPQVWYVSPNIPSRDHIGIPSHNLHPIHTTDLRTHAFVHA